MKTVSGFGSCWFKTYPLWLPKMDPTSHSLFVSAKAGDELAQARIYAIYRPFIERIAFCCGVRNADIEDVAHETLTKFFKKLPAFEPQGIGSLRTWLRTVTKHTVSELRRSLGRWQTADAERLEALVSRDDAVVDKLLGESDAKEMYEALWKVVQNEFSNRDMNIFHAYFFEDRPTKEVAEVYDVTTVVVYNVRTRVLRRLRKLAVDFYGKDLFDP